MNQQREGREAINAGARVRPNWVQICAPPFMTCGPLSKPLNLTLSSSLKWNSKNLPSGPVVKTSPSSLGGTSLIPGQGSRILHAFCPKTPNINQKQYCNTFKQLAWMLKNTSANARDTGDNGSIRGSIDRGAWWAIVHSFAKSQTRLKWLST